MTPPPAPALAGEPDDDPGLFAEPDRLPAPAAELPGLPPDRRRTARQRRDLANGRHPLTRGRLHHDAAPANTPTAPGHRCGTCRHRRLIHHRRRAFPKCWHPGTRGGDEYAHHGPPRLSHSAATDVRAWWPACPDHDPGDPHRSPDAARWIPDPPTAA